jgi:hypothetical protein
MSKFIGALIAIAIDVLGHLIAAIIERQSFFDQLISIQGIIILIALVLIGVIAGILLDKSHQSTASPSVSGNLKDNSVKQTITASRGGKVSKSPQSVKGDIVGREIIQDISAAKKGEVTDSGQSIDIS